MKTKFTLNYAQLLTLYNSIALLDKGRQVVVKGETEVVVQEPYKLPMNVRITLLENLMSIEKVTKTYEETRDKIIKVRAQGRNTIKQGDEGFEETLAELEALLKENVEIELNTIPINDLNLEENNIDVMTLKNSSILLEF